MNTFGTLNTVILAIYLAAMLLIGLFFSRRQTSGEDFFLGGRRLPWLAVAMSMYASLTSAVTYLGLPATAYAENISLIVVSIVSPLTVPLLLKVFYPAYLKLGVTTSYEYINHRFGPAARMTVAGLFILARIGWLATVIYAPAMAMAVATGLPLTLCILLMGLLATAYTAMGGLAAVVWTDAVQFVILIGGALWIAFSLPAQIPDGTAAILKTAAQNGKMHIADWSFNLFAMAAPITALSFFFQLLQDYGTDQVTVQRLLATGTRRGIVRAVIFNACTDFFIIGLLLFIGLGLFSYYQIHPALLPTDLPADRMLPHYIMHSLPAGVSGLLITAVFAAAMSSMDSGINSLSAVIVNDFLRPLNKLKKNREVRIARTLTVVIGIISTATAFYVAGIGQIIKAFASFTGMFSAPVLVLFMLGMLSRKTTFRAWLAGTAASIGGSFILQHIIQAHWVWYFPAAFFSCALITLLLSLNNRPVTSS